MDAPSNLNEQKLAFTAKEFSEIIGISIPTLARDRATRCLGGIPYVKLGGKILYVRSTILDYLNKLTIFSNQEQKATNSEKIEPENKTNLPKRKAGRPKGTTKKAMKQRHLMRPSTSQESNNG